jgi:hypothetical protein
MTQLVLLRSVYDVMKLATYCLKIRKQRLKGAEVLGRNENCSIVLGLID